METAVANAIVTQATGLTAPAPAAVPAAPAASPAAGTSTATETSPHVAQPKHELGASPTVADKPKSRDQVIRDLANGNGESQKNDVLSQNHDNAAVTKIVDTSAGTEPLQDGAEVTSTGDAVGTEGAVVDASGAATQGDGATEPSAAVAPPSQEVLEMGADVGTGDTLFRIRDKDTGQWKPTPTDTIEIAIRGEDGQVRTYEKSLPEIVRMARDGVFGMKLQNEVKYYRDNVGTWQQNAQSLQQKLDAQMQLNREMLSSEEAYLARREQYQQESAPERRLQVLQQQLAERDKREQARQAQDAQVQARQQLAQQVNGFYQARIQPTVNEALKVLPPEMVIGRISTDTLPLMVNGVIPPQHWPQYEAYVRGPFAQWVKTEGAKWTQNAQARDVAAKAATEAQKAAQKAKQEQARTMQPVGRSPQNATATEAPVKLPPPKNKREALDRLVSRPLEG